MLFNAIFACLTRCCSLGTMDNCMSICQCLCGEFLGRVSPLLQSVLISLSALFLLDYPFEQQALSVLAATRRTCPCLSIVVKFCLPRCKGFCTADSSPPKHRVYCQLNSWKDIGNNKICDKIQSRSIILSKVTVFEMFPQVFDDHSCFQSRY